MATVKGDDIDYVEILSDLAIVLDASMVIRSNHDDQRLANQMIEFCTGLAGRASKAGSLNHDS